MLKSGLGEAEAQHPAAGGFDRAPGMVAARPRVLVAQLGARRHYAVPRALWRAGLLDRLVTDFCADAGPWPVLGALLPEAARPAGLRRLLARGAGIPPARLVSLAGFAFDPRLRRRGDEAQTDFWARRNAAFCHAVLKLGLGAADTVYAFNGAALELFQAARARGLGTILDQTAAPWRWNSALLQAEAERWPGWEPRPAEVDLSGSLAAREEAEWALADAIVVGSAFASTALAETGGPAERTAVVAYPAPALGPSGRIAKTRPAAFSAARKLRVLFVGTLQLRKGIQYLYEAAGLLRGEPVEFRAVGHSHLSAEATALVGQRVALIGAVPRAEVARHYDWADVFVLPTLSEGSANVCYEAAAAGLPVITTPNAGSVLEDGRSGLIVPAGSGEGIAGALIGVLCKPVLLPRLAEAACAMVSAPTVARYAAGLTEIVQRSSRGRGLGTACSA